MSKTEFWLQVSEEKRCIRLRLVHPQHVNAHHQLVIIVTGLHSHMDKDTQQKLAADYQDAGFSTLQFNFMGHGEKQNKSDGNIAEITFSSGIKDLQTVWNYALTLADKVDTQHIAIAANSYGAIVSLMALEQNIISPESMALISPFVLDRFKRWSLLLKLIPSLTLKLLKIPVSPSAKFLIKDFYKNHANAMSKHNLLGNTGVRFFVGSDDKIAPVSDVEKWCKVFNSQMPENVPFVDDVQTSVKVYDNVRHFIIPDNVAKDMCSRSIKFIKQMRDIRSK